MTESVTIENVAQVRRIIGQLAPEAKKALDKANREAGAPLIALAQSFVPTQSPLSNWRSDGNGMWNDGQGRGWDTATVKRGIKIKAGRRSRKSPWSALTVLYNDSAAGAIFETAGSKSPNSIFNINLSNAGFPYKNNGVTRVIWRAIKEYPIRKYREQVLKNYEDAVKIAQAELDRLTNNG
jgi:hypothetical protein